MPRGVRADRAEQVEGERRRRRGSLELSGQKLVFNRELFDEKKYAYRVINDDGRKIMSRTELDDYELVDDPAKALKEDNTDLGSKVSIVVGRNEDGSPMRGYLARKLRRYYDADQKEKVAKNNETMMAISEPKMDTKHRTYSPSSRRMEAGDGPVSIT